MDSFKPLSEKDEALIRLLQINARESVSNLARQMGVSRTAVQERLHRLTRMKIIEGYTVKLNPDWQRNQIRTFIALTVNPKHAKQAIQQLERMPHIKALWTVSGAYDLLAEASAPTTEMIDLLLDDVGEIEGVTKTESSVVLSTKIERR